MADSLSIAPVSLSGLTGTLPVASLQATSARTTLDVSPIAGGTNGVELSTTGRLLSAVSTFRQTLQALPTSAADSVPAGTAAAATASPPATGATAIGSATTPPASAASTAPVIATALSLIEAFNALQDSADALPAIAAPLPGADLASQLAQALNVLATSPLATASAELISLQTIGIEPLPAAAPPATGSGLALQLDPALLSAAVAADPAATQAVLTGATQAFIDFAGEFEATVIAPLAPPLLAEPPTPAALAVTPAAPDAAVALAVEPPPALAGIAVPVAPPAIPPAADLVIPPAAPAPTADTPPAIDTSANDARLAALLNAGRPPDVNATAVATLALGTPTPLAPAAPPIGAAAVPPPAVAPLTTPALTPAVVVTATVPATPAVAAADVMAAERRATAATQALQIQLTDPRRRAIANQLDPAYSAVIAATHLSDFVAPRPVIEPKALASDAVAPVSALVRARAIASYAEEAGAGEVALRRIIGTSTTRQYWV